MQGWEETKKALIQRGASGDLINKQKAAYFGAYKGGFDDEGFKRDFTAGRTSGVYDIAEDAKKAMTNIGETGVIVGKNGSKVEPIDVMDSKGNIVGRAWKTWDASIGQYVRNDNQIDAVKSFLKAEYGDSATDRGLFAKISGITLDDINSTIDNVAKSMISNRYAQLPQDRTSISGMTGAAPKGADKSTYWNPSQYQRINGTPDSISKGDEKLKTVISGIDKKTGMFNPELIKEDSGLMTKVGKEVLQATDFYIDPLLEGLIDTGRDVLGMKKLNRSDKGMSAKASERLSTSTRAQAKELFENSKKAYSALYDDIMKNGYIDPESGRRIAGNDALFINLVSNIERNNAVKKYILYGLDDQEVFDKILFKAIESPSSKTFIEMKKDGSEGSAVTKDEMMSKMSDAKISDKKQILVNDDGDMFVQIGDKDWKINREVLPVQLKTDKKSMKLIKDGLYNYRLTKKQMDELSNTDFEFGDISVRIEIDSRNPQMRRYLVVSDPQNNGKEIVLDSPAQLQLYIANQIYKGASYETQQKPHEQ